MPSISPRSLIALAAVLVACCVSAPVAVAKGGGSGGGGTTSGSVSGPVMPADFPSDVPLPAGQLFGSTGSDPSWSVGLTLRGDYQSVMASVANFYWTNGYQVTGDPAAYSFTNGTYAVQFVGAARDHSASQTNVTIVVRRR